MDTEWVYTHIRPQTNLFHHDCCYQVKSPPESHASPHCGVFSANLRLDGCGQGASLIDILCTDLPPASRTKGHSESTSLLGARPKSCAHCLVLAETARLCGTSAEGFENHDPSGRSGLPSARMLWRLWCASQYPVQTWLQAARYDFAYPFLLRVPSALLVQFSPSLLTLGEERTWYDPVRFAGKRTNVLALSHLACAKGLIP